MADRILCMLERQKSVAARLRPTCRTSATALTLALAAGLVGCGQKGPLTLPAAASAASGAASAAPAR
jgi:predicted small lipoprotein YifL